MILETAGQEIWFSTLRTSELSLLVDSLTQPIKTKHCYSNGQNLPHFQGRMKKKQSWTSTAESEETLFPGVCGSHSNDGSEMKMQFTNASLRNCDRLHKRLTLSQKKTFKQNVWNGTPRPQQRGRFCCSF